MIDYKTPEKFCNEAKQYMNNLLDLLNTENIITNLDLAAITLLGNTYNTYCIASKIILEEGIMNEEGKRVHPCIKIANDAQIQLQKLLIEFGLSPKSRKRITPVKDRDVFSPMELFLNKKIETR